MERDYRYVVRRTTDGLFFVGCGYGGPGKPVPYFHADIRDVKMYKYPTKARDAAQRFGGALGMVRLDPNGTPAEWLGYVIEKKRTEGQGDV